MNTYITNICKGGRVVNPIDCFVNILYLILTNKT